MVLQQLRDLRFREDEISVFMRDLRCLLRKVLGRVSSGGEVPLDVFDSTIRDMGYLTLVGVLTDPDRADAGNQRTLNDGSHIAHRTQLNVDRNAHRPNYAESPLSAPEVAIMPHPSTTKPPRTGVSSSTAPSATATSAATANSFPPPKRTGANRSRKSANRRAQRQRKLIAERKAREALLTGESAATATRSDNGTGKTSEPMTGPPGNAEVGVPVGDLMSLLARLRNLEDFAKSYERENPTTTGTIQDPNDVQHIIDRLVDDRRAKRERIDSHTRRERLHQCRTDNEGEPTVGVGVIAEAGVKGVVAAHVATVMEEEQRRKRIRTDMIYNDEDYRRHP